MIFPGFTAEASLGRSIGSYRTVKAPGEGGTLVRPAQAAHWDLLLDPYFRLSRFQGPPVEPSCFCLRYGADGRCQRWICF
jgi:hypothetical protein